MTAKNTTGTTGNVYPTISDLSSAVSSRMYFKIIALILASILSKSYQSCEFNREENSIKCENVQFPDITKLYADTKEIIFSATITNCTKKNIAENEVEFTNVQKLAISCNIETLNTHSFANLLNLQVLNLSSNKISTIPNNLYQQLPNLEVLNLSQNLLRNPTIDMLYYLIALQTLDLSFNRITNIDLGVLDQLKNLKRLNLSHNGLFYLQLGVFDELANLETLDLSYNNLNEIPNGLFDQTLKLAELNLAENKFTQILLGELDGLKNLLHIDLSKNEIRQLPLGIFDQLKKLHYLDLHGNDFVNLTLGLFDELEYLSTINLSGCNLKTVPNGIFDKNKLLLNLDLSQNKIATTLSDGTLDDTKRLKFLNLSSNGIKTLPTNLFQQTELQVIDLSFNFMLTIQPDLLNMETLREVHVHNNRIAFLDATTFATNGNPLKYLDISHNRLVCLEIEFFSWVANLERFKIAGNPWDCKQLDKMIHIMTSRFISYRVLDYFQGQKPVCVSPDGELKQCIYNKTVIQSYYDLYSSA